MKKDMSWLYNLALAAICILLIPVFSFNDHAMIAILAITVLVIGTDIIRTLKWYIRYRSELKYIKSMSTYIHQFYIPMHRYFAENYREYPDNSTDIVAVAYRMLLDKTDINENEYTIYITKGAVDSIAHPHYWLTIFAKWDLTYSYPFIIDVNSLRYKADRSMSFDKVMQSYKETILGVHDKEYKTYRPYTFFQLDISSHRPVMVGNDKKKLVYISTVTEDKLPITDYKEVSKIVNKKINSSVTYIFDKSQEKNKHIEVDRSADPNGENN